MSQLVTHRKAFAYITHNNHLLVFEHPDSPEAGIQVPAGSIESGESPRAGALREAQEESGLTGLSVCCFLGEQTRDMSDFPTHIGQVHHRYFYHLLCHDDHLPDSWLHGERFPSAGAYADSPPPVDEDGFTHRFRFFWARLPDDVPPLIADHDYYLSALIEHLRRNR
jgi:8-oxo-dGTP pyrophosphatase MutT (NUDIX family)